MQAELLVLSDEVWRHPLYHSTPAGWADFTGPADLAARIRGAH